MEKVSLEAIEKAQIVLGLKKADVSTNAIAEAAKAEELKKAEEVKNQLTKEYTEALQKAEELKAKIDGTEASKVEKEIVKAVTEAPKNEAFEKAITEQIGSLAILIQAKNEESEELKKAVDELSVKLVKAEEFNTVLGKKVGILAKQPLDRKSVTTKEFIEKGGEAAEKIAGNGRVLSFSNKEDRAEISELLFAKATEVEGKVNPTFEKAVTYVEMGRFPGKQEQVQVQEFLKKEHSIELVK